MLILLIIIFWLLHCYVFLIRSMISKIFSRVHMCSSFQWDLFLCHFPGAFGWAIDGCGMVWASSSRCLLRHGWECASLIGFCWRRGKCATQGTSREGAWSDWKQKNGSECWRLLNASVSTQSNRSVAFVGWKRFGSCWRPEWSIHSRITLWFECMKWTTPHLHPLPTCNTGT